PEIRITRPFNALLHVAGTAVVGGHRQVPVSVEVVEIAEMLRRRTRGLLGILALINPPGMPEAILVPAVRHELPDPSSACARKRQWLEGALGLRQVNQILRQSFFPQHAGNHLAVTSGASQSRFHNGTPSRCLEKIEERKDLVV